MDTPILSPASSIDSDDIIEEFIQLNSEEQAMQRSQWSEELNKVERDIERLQSEMDTKHKNAKELKKRLGTTACAEEPTNPTNVETVFRSTSNFFESLHSKVKALQPMMSFDRFGTAFFRRTRFAQSRSESSKSSRDDSDSTSNSAATVKDNPLAGSSEN